MPVAADPDRILAHYSSRKIRSMRNSTRNIPKDFTSIRCLLELWFLMPQNQPI